MSLYRPCGAWSFFTLRNQGPPTPGCPTLSDAEGCITSASASETFIWNQRHGKAYLVLIIYYLCNPFNSSWMFSIFAKHFRLAEEDEKSEHALG